MNLVIGVHIGPVGDQSPDGGRLSILSRSHERGDVALKRTIDAGSSGNCTLDAGNVATRGVVEKLLVVRFEFGAMVLQESNQLTIVATRGVHQWGVTAAVGQIDIGTALDEEGEDAKVATAQGREESRLTAGLRGFVGQRAMRKKIANDVGMLPPGCGEEWT